MRILLLGANGFIGSHLTEKILDASDDEVVAFDIKGCLLYTSDAADEL